MLQNIDYESASISILKEYNNTNNKECLCRLYNMHKGLFYKVVQKFTPFMEIDDLLQECYFALIKAVEGYQEKKGSFTNYLATVTNNYLYRSILKTSYLPEYMQSLIKSYLSLMEDLKEKGNNNPSDSIIINALNISPETLQTIKKAISIKNIMSLEAPINDEGLTIGDIVKSSQHLEEDCISAAFQEEVKYRVWDCIYQLSVKDQYYIINRYIEEKTYKEIDNARSVAATRMKTEKAFKRLRKIGQVQLSSLKDEYIYNRAIHGGVNQFKRTWTSSTERIILKAEERGRL